MTNKQAIIIASMAALVLLVVALDVAGIINDRKLYQPQPVIHCLDGFYAYTETREGIEHIYCLQKKYEVPETE